MKQKKVNRVALLLRESPFYAESGGQVSDRGEIVGDGWRLDVDDVRKVEGRPAAVGRLSGEFRFGMATARVPNEPRRERPAPLPPTIAEPQQPLSTPAVMPTTNPAATRVASILPAPTATPMRPAATVVSPSRVQPGSLTRARDVSATAFVIESVTPEPVGGAASATDTPRSTTARTNAAALGRLMRRTVAV